MAAVTIWGAKTTRSDLVGMLRRRHNAPCFAKCTYSPHICLCAEFACKELGVEYKLIELDFEKQEHKSADFLKVIFDTFRGRSHHGSASLHSARRSTATDFAHRPLRSTPLVLCPPSRTLTSFWHVPRPATSHLRGGGPSPSRTARPPASFSARDAAAPSRIAIVPILRHLHPRADRERRHDLLPGGPLRARQLPFRRRYGCQAGGALSLDRVCQLDSVLRPQCQEQPQLRRPCGRSELPGCGMRPVPVRCRLIAAPIALRRGPPLGWAEPPTHWQTTSPALNSLWPMFRSPSIWPGCRTSSSATKSSSWPSGRRLWRMSIASSRGQLPRRRCRWSGRRTTASSCRSSPEWLRTSQGALRRTASEGVSTVPLFP